MTWKDWPGWPHNGGMTCYIPPRRRRLRLRNWTRQCPMHHRPQTHNSPLSVQTTRHLRQNRVQSWTKHPKTFCRSGPPTSRRRRRSLRARAAHSTSSPDVYPRGLKARANPRMSLNLHRHHRRTLRFNLKPSLSPWQNPSWHFCNRGLRHRAQMQRRIPNSWTGCRSAFWSIGWID